MPIPRDLSIPSWHGTLWDEFCTDCPSVLSNDFRKLIMGSSIKDGCRRRTTFASEADSGGISGLGSKEHCVYSIASIWSVVAPHFSNNGIIFVWPTWDISHNSAKHTLRLKSCFCASLPITLKSKKRKLCGSGGSLGWELCFSCSVHSCLERQDEKLHLAVLEVRNTTILLASQCLQQVVSPKWPQRGCASQGLLYVTPSTSMQVQTTSTAVPESCSLRPFQWQLMVSGIQPE